MLRRDVIREDAAVALLLACALGASCMLYTSMGVYEDPAPPWLSAVLLVGNAAPLAFRRQWPVVAALVSATAFIVAELVHVPEGLFVNLTLFIALYSVGAWCGQRGRALVARAVIIASMFAAMAMSLAARGSIPSATTATGAARVLEPAVASALLAILVNTVYFAGAWYLGDRAWAASLADRQLRARTAELAAARERAALQAIALERMRIARELHDVVAHHVSVMGVQAGAARRTLDRNPTQASESLAIVEDNARLAVEELRLLVGTLREPAGEGDVHVDAPSTAGLHRLDGLVATLIGAGHVTRLSVVGEPRTVPPIVAAVAFRVAQEAATNVLRHAGAGAQVDMRLRFEPRSIEIEISDAGAGARARRERGGYGQIGMRERVVAVGGDLEARPLDRGGYLVRARLPTD